MAYELLVALEGRRKIPHEVHHDVESFIWVFIYAILLPEDKERQKADYEGWKRLDDAIQLLFTSTSVCNLVAGRAKIKLQAECLPDDAVRECAAEFLLMLHDRDNIVLKNHRVAKRAARRGRAVNPGDILALPILDHDSVIAVFEEGLEAALADENAPAQLLCLCCIPGTVTLNK